MQRWVAEFQENLYTTLASLSHLDAADLGSVPGALEVRLELFCEADRPEASSPLDLNAVHAFTLLRVEEERQVYTVVREVEELSRSTTDHDS